MQCAAYTPPPLKLSHRYATEVDFQIYELGPLANYIAHDFLSQSAPAIVISMLCIVYLLYYVNKHQGKKNHVCLIEKIQCPFTKHMDGIDS